MVTAEIVAEDGLARCPWSGQTSEFISYHDQEWGFPVADQTRLFEKLCLESFQAGLSWHTILAKRENFRRAFAGFEIDYVAAMTRTDVDRLLRDAGIIRHRGKIEAVINNAQRTQELLKTDGSLAAYLWSYEPAAAALPAPQSRTTSPEAIALAKDLKSRGWKFVGPTTIYAFMQSMGLINDHALGCITREQVAVARDGFTRP